MSAAPLLVSMWSGPRNISTALMYSWRERADTRVHDEPFYGCYLERFDPGHPGRDEIIASMECDPGRIIDELGRSDGPPVRYIKNIAHHLDALDPAVLDRFVNVLLIRDPAEVIPSLTARIGEDDNVTPSITGFPQLVQILDHEIASGRSPLVVDSAEVLADPAVALAAVCAQLGLSPDPAMLSWPPGPKPEDGVWAKHWYASVHRSTGFEPRPARSEKPTTRQSRLIEACRPFYERLRRYSHQDPRPSGE